MFSHPERVGLPKKDDAVAEPVRVNRGLAQFEPIVAEAALGNLEAQRALFRAALTDALNDQHPYQALATIEAVCIGRMCASRGLEIDARPLAAVLSQSSWIMKRAGCTELADNLMAEAIVILEQLAARGDEYAEQAVHAFVDTSDPDVVHKARALCAADDGAGA